MAQGNFLTEQTPHTTLVDVHIRALSSEGAGVADLADGRVVFVPRTAPGDHVRVRLVKMKARWGTATVEEILEPSPTRVQPPCKLFDECGGCSFQHISAAEQLHWKGRFIADALKRIGRIDVEAPEVVASPATIGYRNRVAYTFRRLRAGRVVAGFHALDRPAHVLDVEGQCQLPEPAVREAWKALRLGWGGGGRLLPGGGRLRLILRNTSAGVILVVEGGEEGWSAKPLAEAVPKLQSIWHKPSGGKQAVRVHGEQALEVWGGETFPLTAGAFLQVNQPLAEALRDFVLESARDAGLVVDAYCGVGAYARPLARAGAHVVGIELDLDACSAARYEAPEDLIVVKGRVEDVLSDHLPADVLIVNPPRTGLDVAVPDIVLADPPQKIIYVSCDPATLARDIGRLGSSYQIVALKAFDLFPQTAHIETVAVLERVEASS